MNWKGCCSSDCTSQFENIDLPSNMKPIIFILLVWHSGPGSSVGIATGYGLGGLGIESRWGRDFPPVQIGPGAHPASCTMSTVSFPGVKSGRGVTLTPHPLLVPWSRKSRAIRLPSPPLRAVQPVQILSACTRVHFIMTYVNISERFKHR